MSEKDLLRKWYRERDREVLLADEDEVWWIEHYKRRSDEFICGTFQLFGICMLSALAMLFVVARLAVIWSK